MIQKCFTAVSSFLIRAFWAKMSCVFKGSLLWLLYRYSMCRDSWPSRYCCLVRNREDEQQGKCFFVKFGQMSVNALTKKERKEAFLKLKKIRWRHRTFLAFLALSAFSMFSALLNLTRILKPWRVRGTHLTRLFWCLWGQWEEERGLLNDHATIKEWRSHAAFFLSLLLNFGEATTPSLKFPDIRTPATIIYCE